MKFIIAILFTFFSTFIFSQENNNTFHLSDTDFVVGTTLTIEALDYKNDFDKFNFDKVKIDSLADLMNKYKGLKIEITCNTDYSESPLLSMMATADQAEEIRMYLVRKGVVGSRIEVYGNGEMNPIYFHNEMKYMTEEQKVEANKNNRRTEVLITDFQPLMAKKKVSKGVKSYPGR